MAEPDQTVAVIGAGVVGLSCAIRLREAGRKVVVYAERRTPHVTSDRAGAVFSPFRMSGDAAADLTRVSLEAFESLARDQSQASGVRMVGTREMFFTPQPVDPWWAAMMKEFRRTDGAPSPYASELYAVMPGMDMRRYMPWLEREFTERLEGSIVVERLSRFDALFERGHRIIVNCAGLGAGALASDDRVQPYRGQILRVPRTFDLSECILEESVGALTTYVFPFDDSFVLGGTFEQGETLEQTDAASLDSIFTRSRNLLLACGIDDARNLSPTPIESWAGIRPCRTIGDRNEAIRLECESAGHDRWMVHNYGHGRAGVTLSWGCADQVTSMIDRLRG